MNFFPDACAVVFYDKSTREPTEMALIDEKGKAARLSLPKEIRGEIETGGTHIAATYPAKRIGSSYVLPTITSERKKVIVVKRGRENPIRVLPAERNGELLIIESDEGEMVIRERGMDPVVFVPGRKKRGTDRKVKPLFYETNVPTSLLPVCVAEGLADKPIVIHEDDGNRKILSLSETFRYEIGKGEVSISAVIGFESYFYTFLESEGIDKNGVKRYIFGGEEFVFVVNAVEGHGLYAMCFDANNGDFLFGEWMKREKGKRVPFLTNLRFDDMVEKNGRLFVSFSGHTRNRNRYSVYSIYEESKKIRGKRTFVSRTVVENPTEVFVGISQDASFFYHMKRVSDYLYEITIYEPRSKRTLVRNVPASRERNGFIVMPRNPKDADSIFFLSGYYGKDDLIAVERIGGESSDETRRRVEANLEDPEMEFDVETGAFVSDGVFYATVHSNGNPASAYVPVPMDATGKSPLNISGKDLLYSSFVSVIDVRRRKITETILILRNEKKRAAFDGNMEKITLPKIFTESDGAYVLRVHSKKEKTVLVGAKECDGKTRFFVYEKEGDGKFRSVFDKIFDGEFHYREWVPSQNGISVLFATKGKNGENIESLMRVAVAHETGETKILHFDEKEINMVKKIFTEMGRKVGLSSRNLTYRTSFVESMVRLDNVFFLSYFLENAQIERTVGMESKEPGSSRER